MCVQDAAAAAAPEVHYSKLMKPILRTWNYFLHTPILEKPRHQKQKGFCKTFGESPLAHTLKKFRSEEEGVWASLFCHCSPVVPFAV